MTPVYEDNHIIVVNKRPGEIVQGDKTGDTPLSAIVKLYLKKKYNKPGNVFCGTVHRIDRPVGGLVIFAKTSKALSRLNDMLRKGEIHKSYLAVVEGKPNKENDTLKAFLFSNGRVNKSFISHIPKKDYKDCALEYEVIGYGERYSLLKVNLLTGRKHQIRAMLSHIGHPIKGDLKYGAKRSNPDGSISLIAHRLDFVHPVSHKHISLESTLPSDPLFHL